MRLKMIVTVLVISGVLINISNAQPVLTLDGYYMHLTDESGSASWITNYHPDATRWAANPGGYLGLGSAASSNTSSQKAGIWAWGLGNDGDKYGVYGQSNGDYGDNYGVYGIAYSTADSCIGVYGEADAEHGHGGHFVNSDTTAAGSQVGLWAGSFYGNIIEGHEVNAQGSPTNLRFRVAWTGFVYADGSFVGGGADFAESIIPHGGKDRYEPGEILEISAQPEDVTHTFAKSKTPYSTKIAGIYSTKPGFIGNRGGINDSNAKEEIPMAVLGIVPCKVSTENGPIVRGDLLVSSSTPGHAMKGTDKLKMIGSVVGKALENLDSGKGTIDVLVTLQ